MIDYEFTNDDLMVNGISVRSVIQQLIPGMAFVRFERNFSGRNLRGDPPRFNVDVGVADGTDINVFDDALHAAFMDVGWSVSFTFPCSTG